MPDQDGREFPAEVSTSTIKDLSGKPTAFVVIAKDITEHKRMETKLEQTVEDMKRANITLERFINVAYHDLQEPLRMVSCYVQLLERRYKGKLDEDADEII